MRSYKGKYHLFYQHFPYAPQWGRMHWGHAVSDDLMHWQHLDIALFPSKIDDMDGCFSGSAIEKDGRLHLFYTGIRYEEYNPENTNCSLDDRFVAAQMKITSEDGYTFDNFGAKRTIIPPITDNGIGNRVHTRDPKVWQGHDGNFYIVLGSTVNGRGRLLFYKSRDLEDWEYANHAELTNTGWMWECPDYFETDGQGVVIFSPMGLETGSQTVCTTAIFHEKDCSMQIDPNRTYFDLGFDLYAPQSTTDKDGRRTVLAWLRMPEKADDNTIGMFCMPRLCKVKDGKIFFMPHPDIKAKFGKKINSPEESEGAYLIRTSVKDGDWINVGGYVIGRKNGRVCTDRTAVINGRTDICCRFETPVVSCGEEIEIYVDENITTQEMFPASTS